MNVSFPELRQPARHHNPCGPCFHFVKVRYVLLSFPLAYGLAIVCRNQNCLVGYEVHGGVEAALTPTCTSSEVQLGSCKLSQPRLSFNMRDNDSIGQVKAFEQTVMRIFRLTSYHLSCLVQFQRVKTTIGIS